MIGVPGTSRRGSAAKWAAIGLIIVLEVGALLYVYQTYGAPQGQGITFHFPSTTKSVTTTTTTTNKTLNSVAVQSATIQGDSLSMKIKNTGIVWTQNITLAYVCTSDLKNCYSYKILSGKSRSGTFALAPKAVYTYTFANVCVVPKLSCAYYFPVANFSYYFGVTFGFQSGPSTVVPVTAKAIDTVPIAAALQGLTYKLDTFSKNNSGVLTVNIAVDPSRESASFIESISARVGMDGFSATLLYEKTGCGPALAMNCSLGTLTDVRTFSTVTTGIGTPIHPLPYLLLVRDMAAKVKPRYFAVWVPTVGP